MIIDAHINIDFGVNLHDVESNMETLGIDLAIASPSKKEFAFENQAGNLRMVEACQKVPRLRFWAVATPWSDSCRSDLQQAIDLGATGVAFDSSVQGFSLLGKEIQDLLEYIVDKSMPVYFHTGTPIFALPLQLAYLAKKFPELNFIMGRSGRTDFRTDAIPAMKQATNLYADTAHDYPMTGLLNLRDAVGSHRMIFTSDFPFESQEFALRCINDMSISLQEKEQVLGGNIRQLIGGKEI